MRLVPIEKLVPYINNARTHSPEQINKLRSSLREFGFINPVIIDRDYGVITGHGRILAAKEEGSRSIRSSCGVAPPYSPAQFSRTIWKISAHNRFACVMYVFAIATYGDWIAAPVVGCLARNPS